jgi:CMP/dCMP kinase
MSKEFHLAMDGPVAAGKGTGALLVAKRLGFLYVDTGAMYRVAAYLAILNDLDLKNEAGVSELVAKSDIQMRNPDEAEQDGRLTTVTVDGDDVSWKIRTEQISAGASAVAMHKKVREVLVAKQQQIAKGQNVVMEGRDITYRVLPNANLKIYLTAGDLVRAKRRHFQLQSRGQDISFDEVYQELLKRDRQDMTRQTDPLRIVEDAWVIDSSDLSIEQVVELIVGKVRVMQEAD